MRHHNVCRTFQQLRPSWFSSPVEMRQNKPKESEMQRNKCTVQSKNNTATIKNHLFISMGIFSYKKRTISPHHFWRFHRVVRRGERGSYGIFRFVLYQRLRTATAAWHMRHLRLHEILWREVQILARKTKERVMVLCWNFEQNE